MRPVMFLQDLIHREASRAQETQETHHELLSASLLNFLLRACEMLFYSECQ